MKSNSLKSEIERKIASKISEIIAEYKIQKGNSLLKSVEKASKKIARQITRKMKSAIEREVEIVEMKVTPKRQVRKIPAQRPVSNMVKKPVEAKTLKPSKEVVAPRKYTRSAPPETISTEVKEAIAPPVDLVQDKVEPQKLTASKPIIKRNVRRKSSIKSKTEPQTEVKAKRKYVRKVPKTVMDSGKNINGEQDLKNTKATTRRKKTP